MTPAMASTFAPHTIESPEEEAAQMNVTGEALQALDRIAEREGIDRATALAAAISFKDWVDQQDGRLMLARRGQIRAISKK